MAETKNNEMNISSAIKVGFICIKEACSGNPLAIAIIYLCIEYASKKGRTRDCEIFEKILEKSNNLEGE